MFWRSCILLLAMLVPSRALAGPVVVVELADTIQPASLRYLERGLREAARSEAELVIIELDTPGGLVTSLRAMISAILRSPVTVAVYVAPAGAHAASAGFFLLLASDVAAMAPGTNTGAAHPVRLGQAVDEEDVSMEKATEDAAALARSLASQRGRAGTWAEKAVRESLSYSADEALRHGLIELVAPSRAALVEKLDGTLVKRPDGTQQTLSLGRPEVVVVEPTFSERVLSVIADPQIAYLLLMLGVICLGVEILSPGLIVPGVIGAVSVLLAMYGFSLLPVSWVGALLIAAGLGLVIAEVFVTSYGLLAVGGIISFAVGSLMLVEGPIPSLRIGPEVILPATAVLTALAVLLVIRTLRTRPSRLQTGLEAMIGERGEVVADIDPEREGTVFVHGEYWTAAAPQPLRSGTKVRVERIDGVRLHVAPIVHTATRGESG